MLERVYKADRFDDALAQIKRELGPDAIITSSRQVGGGLTGRTSVELKAVSKQEAVQAGIVREESSTSDVTLVERRLRRMGVPTSTARTLTRHVHRHHGGAPRSLEEAMGALTKALESQMIFAEPQESRARVVALVGPTGVGKTTTVAKLAAIAALIDRKNVALVSLDQYRIGGTEQLQRFAELIGIPMATAHDAHSLEIALRKHAQADLVLLDTAGRSPRDVHAIAEMADTLHGVDEQVEVHLCLPAAMRDCEIDGTVERLAPLQATRLICTKMDEAIYHGAVIAAQVTSGLPMAYFTTGQRVPEDIEIASAERLSALLCGKEEV